MSTIAQKCRNPLNIRASVKNNWLGSRGSYKGFVVFNSSKMGYRAALMLLRNYVRKGYDTVGSIINRWAPPSENDTESYVKTVCSLIDDACTPETKIVGTATLCMLCRAMARVESGVEPAGLDYLWSICLEFRIFVEPSEYKLVYGKREKVNLD